MRFNLFFILLVCHIPIFAAELPLAPAGYKWVELREYKSAFLKPAQWFEVQRHLEPGIFGLLLTKEDIQKQGYSCTGLVVFIALDAAKKVGIPPSEHARNTVMKMAREEDVVKAPWAKTQDIFQSHGIVFKSKDKNCGDVTEYFLGIGNDATGTYYTISFKAPTSSWNEAWKTAEPMLKKFLIDTDI